MPQAQFIIVTQFLRRLLGSAAARRWVLALVLPFAGVLTAFGIAPDTVTDSVERISVVEDVAIQPALSAAIKSADQTQTYWREETIRRGDTLPGVLARLLIEDAEALAFVNAAPEARPLFQMAPGRSLRAETNSDGKLLTLYYVNGERSFTVMRQQDGFVLEDQPAALDKRVVAVSGLISGSIFASADALGIPDAIVKQMIELFSTEIDFRRGVRTDDRFTVIYETLLDHGEPVGAGRLLAAEFTNRGKAHNIMWFEPNPERPGGGAYFTLAGRDIRKGAFLRSPLEFSRISSGFSDERYHPILNTSMAHKGVDFVAPLGTNIRAVADGVVDFAGVQAGYGNVVILRHHDKYSTLYAHMADFAPEIKEGTRVLQGEVIGTVGMTGLTTGPHVHFEFRIDDVHQDPESVAMPTALPLPPELKQKLKVAAAPVARTLQLLRDVKPAFE